MIYPQHSSHPEEERLRKRRASACGPWSPVWEVSFLEGDRLWNKTSCWLCMAHGSATLPGSQPRRLLEHTASSGHKTQQVLCSSVPTHCVVPLQAAPHIRQWKKKTNREAMGCQSVECGQVQLHIHFRDPSHVAQAGLEPLAQVIFPASVSPVTALEVQASLIGELKMDWQVRMPLLITINEECLLFCLVIGGQPIVLALSDTGHSCHSAGGLTWGVANVLTGRLS